MPEPHVSARDADSPEPPAETEDVLDDDDPTEFIRDMASPTDGPDLTDEELGEHLHRTAWQEQSARRSLTPEEQKAILDTAFARQTSPLESLLVKLDEWLLHQPEWPLILAAPRHTRRAALGQLAKHFATIPKPGGSRGQPGGRA